MVVITKGNTVFHSETLMSSHSGIYDLVKVSFHLGLIDHLKTYFKKENKNELSGKYITLSMHFNK